MKLEIAERKQIEAALRKVSEATAPVTGSEYFHSLVQHLATAFGVRSAFISQCEDAANTRVRTLAFWKGDGFGENFAYTLAGTPCEFVIGGEVCYHPEQIQVLFPEDEDLVAIAAESHLGIPLHNASGKLDVQPTEFPLPEFLQSIADMARIRAEQKGLAFLFEPLSPLPGEGSRRRAEAASGLAQLAQQCHQVHRAWRRGAPGQL